MHPVDASIMRPLRPGRTVLLLLLAVASCTATGNTPGERRGSGTITRAELDGSSFTSAHNAVEQLRPAWLRRRAAPSLRDSEPFPVVYVDGLRRGLIDELRAVATADVVTIRYMSPSDATTLFGIGHTSGVILVTTSD